MNENVLIDETKTEVKKAPENGEIKAKKVDFKNIKTDNIKKPSASLNDIDSYLNEYKDAAQIIEPDESTQKQAEEKPKIRRSRKKPEPMVLSGDIITGAMFLSLIDLAIPAIIMTINNTLDKSHKITVEKMRLKASQKKELEPHAEAVMKQLELKANPVVLLLVSMISIYGLNFVNVKYGLDN